VDGFHSQSWDRKKARAISAIFRMKLPLWPVCKDKVTIRIRSYANSGKPLKSKWECTGFHPKVFPLETMKIAIQNFNFYWPVIWVLRTEVFWLWIRKRMKRWNTYFAPAGTTKVSNQLKLMPVTTRRLSTCGFVKNGTRYPGFSKVKTNRRQRWLKYAIRWRSERKDW